MIFGMLYDPLPDAEFILDRFREIKKELQSELEKIENGETTPFNAAKRLLNL